VASRRCAEHLIRVAECCGNSRTKLSKAQHPHFTNCGLKISVVENATGSACEQDINHYPYGGVEQDYCSTQVSQNYKFTGKEHDAESGLDDFGARYYSSSLGRFMTPDWAANAIAVPYANFGDPQTLDLYGYVKNNPINKIDPDGHASAVQDLGYDDMGPSFAPIMTNDGGPAPTSTPSVQTGTLSAHKKSRPKPKPKPKPMVKANPPTNKGPHGLLGGENRKSKRDALRSAQPGGMDGGSRC